MATDPDSTSVATARGQATPAGESSSWAPATQRSGRAVRLLSSRGWMWMRIAADASLLLLAVLAARFGAPEDVSQDGAVLMWLMPPAVMALFALRGLYGRRVESRISDGVGSVVGATSLAAIALIATAALVDHGSEPGPLVARAWLFATVYVASGRMLLTAVLRRARAAGFVGKPTLIVGAGEIGAVMERRLREEPALGLRILGYIDADPPPAEMVPLRRAPVLGAPEELVRIAMETGAEHVILSFSSAPDHGLVPLVRECEANRIEVSLVPRMFESLTKRLQFEQIGALPLVGLRSVDPQGWQFAVKHAFDRVLASLLLLLLLPLLVAIAVAIKSDSPGPALFRQRRIGRDGRAFDMLKFRSMRMPALEDSERLEDLPPGIAPGGVEGADRRTPVGRFLRRHSLDELPQLINVVKGEMSLVGPRPERPEFVEVFGETVRRYEDRHRVKSGITGWAQVNGLRGRTSLADRVRWDNYYIRHWSLGLDGKILILTLTAPFRSSGE